MASLIGQRVLRAIAVMIIAAAHVGCRGEAMGPLHIAAMRGDARGCAGPLSFFRRAKWDRFILSRESKAYATYKTI